jgi:polyferredoxin
MTSEVPQQPLTPEEQALRRRKVRNVVLLRAFLLGLMVSAWWILFAPDSLVDPALKNLLGVAVGLIAVAAYLYFLRDTLVSRRKR